MWKLTDFGISSQGTTTAGIATAHFRGTQGYRCPELLQDNATYNNKADVWALGVIVADFASGTRACLSDMVMALSYHDSDPKFPIELSSSFWAHHFPEFAGDLLRKNWTERPRISQVCKMTSMYCQVSELPITNEVFQSVEYPSYTGLKHIVEARVSQEEVLLYLGAAFLSTYRDPGKLNEAAALHERPMEARKTLRSMNNLANTYRDEGKLNEATALHERTMEARERMLGEE